MRLCRPGCRSLRDLFFVVLVVATLSVLATYHLSKHLPPRQPPELEIEFHGRLGIYHNVDRSSGVISAEDKHLQSSLGDNHRGLEGIDVENWEKRVRERRKGKGDGNVKHKLHPELLHTLKEVRYASVCQESERERGFSEIMLNYI